MTEMKTRTVAELADGDEFTLDGTTWHVCAVPMFGAVAVYLPGKRVGWNNSLTTRIEAARDQSVKVRRTLPRGSRA